MKIKNEFVPVHIAHKLKDLGFDEECIAVYSVYSEAELLINEFTLSIYNSSSRLSSDDCTAPMISQAFRWFRNKYGLQCIIEDDNYNKEFLYKFIVKPKEDFISQESGRCKTYERAEQVCLEKMIQIVKKTCQS